MSEHPDHSAATHGLEEATTPWVTPPVLHARPVEAPVDWDKLIRDSFERFPKIMARLAE